MGFIFGPAIGAVFSSAKYFSSVDVHTYPSYLAITLTVLNIIFVSVFYKESLPLEKRATRKNLLARSCQFINPLSLFKFAPVKSVKDENLSVLRSIGLASFLYLFLYSGLEFTLTFLVHERFSYDR